MNVNGIRKTKKQRGISSPALASPCRRSTTSVDEWVAALKRAGMPSRRQEAEVKGLLRP